MDEWLLRWEDDKSVSVYHWHHWVETFPTEKDARNYVEEEQGVAG